MIFWGNSHSKSTGIPGRASPEKNPGFYLSLVENAMVDAAATGALRAPSLASSSGQGPVNDTNAGPVVPAAAALAEGAPTNTTSPLAAMWGVVEVKEGLGRTDRWLCGRHMGLGGSAGTKKVP